MKKFLSLILALTIITTTLFSFSSCSNGTIEADASDYLTKGEWFNYFVEETGLYSTSTVYDLSIDESSEFYDSVLAIVEYGICTAEVACDGLDEIVNKDVVAYTCVNYLPQAYRKTVTTEFKDSDKITDTAAAAEAVNYGIVESKSKNTFGAEDYLSIEQCEQAISTTSNWEADYEFDESECNNEVEFNDNVKMLNDEIVEVVSSDVSDDTTSNDDDSLVTDLLNDSEAQISNLGTANATNVTSTANTYTDKITVKIEKSVYETNKDAYKVGNVIKFSPFEVYTNKNKTPVLVCYMEITEEPQLDSLKRFYLITGTLPANDALIKRIGENQKDTSKKVKTTECEKYAKSDLGVTGIKFENNGVSFTYTKKASTSKK